MERGKQRETKQSETITSPTIEEHDSLTVGRERLSFFCFFLESFSCQSIICSPCPLLVISLSLHLVRVRGGSRYRWWGWVICVGHRVSLQWHSSLYICLLSRGISCWPKLNGCPSARHLQYWKMGRGKWEKKKSYRTVFKADQVQHICKSATCKPVDTHSYNDKQPASLTPFWPVI